MSFYYTFLDPHLMTHRLNRSVCFRQVSWLSPLNYRSPDLYWYFPFVPNSIFFLSYSSFSFSWIPLSICSCDKFTSTVPCQWRKFLNNIARYNFEGLYMWKWQIQFLLQYKKILLALWNQLSWKGTFLNTYTTL